MAGLVGAGFALRQKIRQLFDAGVDVFRLNFSHGDYAFHRRVIRKIRQLERKLDSEQAVLELRGLDLDMVGELEAAIRAMHPYELPAIHALAFDRVHAPFAATITAITLFLFVHIADTAVVGWGPEAYNRAIELYRQAWFKPLEFLLVAAVLAGKVKSKGRTVVPALPVTLARRKVAPPAEMVAVGSSGADGMLRWPHSLKNSR